MQIKESHENILNFYHQFWSKENGGILVCYVGLKLSATWHDVIYFPEFRKGVLLIYNH